MLTLQFFCVHSTLTRNIKCITSRAHQAHLFRIGKCKSFPWYRLNLYCVLPVTDTETVAVSVWLVESGKVIEKWFALTHKQPGTGQGHRCCPLRNRVESGPEKEKRIEINGGRGVVMMGERERGIQGAEPKGMERGEHSRKWMFTEASTLDSWFNERIREDIDCTHPPYMHKVVTVFATTRNPEAVWKQPPFLFAG